MYLIDVVSSLLLLLLKKMKLKIYSFTLELGT